MRSTDTLLQRVAALEEQFSLLPRGGMVLAAVSGGADSMCLLHLLNTLAPQRGFALEAAHFNHQLRGEDARRDEAFVAQWCRTWHIPLHLGEGDVAGEARRRGTGIEETARTLRYAFLQETAREMGGAVIATAHNADDNGETLLLHLLRGSGLNGLTGISPQREGVIRPLLWVSRQEIERYNEENAVPHVEDSTNSDLRYTRNWVRHQVMPLLREKNPNLTETLTRTALSLGEDNQLLESLAEAALSDVKEEGDTLILPAASITAQPRPIGLRMVQRLVSRLERDCILSAPQRQRVLELAEGENPSASVPLPAGLVARRRYDLLELGRQGEENQPEELTLPLPAVCAWGAVELTVTAAVYQGEVQHPWDFYFRREGETLTLRPRQPGEGFAPVGRREKTLKKWMIEEKIPRSQRERVPVLVQEGAICGVPGLGVSRTAHPHVGQEAWHCRCRPRKTESTEGKDSHGRSEK